MIRLIAILLYLALLLSPAAASAQTTPGPGGPTQTEAQRALEVLEDPQKRAQLIDTLRAITKAAPPVSEAAAAPALSLEPNSLGAQLLSQVPLGRDHAQEAARALRRSLELMPEDDEIGADRAQWAAMVHKFLGDALNVLGQRLEARTHWSRAVALDPVRPPYGIAGEAERMLEQYPEG